MTEQTNDRQLLIETLLDAVAFDYQVGMFTGHPTDGYALELARVHTAEQFGMALDTYVDNRIQAALTRKLQK